MIRIKNAGVTKLGVQPGALFVYILFCFCCRGSAYAQSGGVVTAINISARAVVSLGDKVLIGGFIIVGDSPKRVLIRALGPSLAGGVGSLVDILPDPTLAVYGQQGLIAYNDNWRDAQEQEIIATTIPPPNDFESALVMTLPPGGYTAIVQGKDSSTGVALVELYDLDALNGGGVTNISARGNSTAVESAIIGGFIISGQGSSRVLVRAIGPELAANGLTGALLDTTLELRDSNATLIAFNDDWEADQEAETLFSNEAPTDPRESAIVRTLKPGLYTVIVRGKNDTVGIGLVEVYVLQ